MRCSRCKPKRQLIFDGNSLTANGANALQHGMRWVTTMYPSVIALSAKIPMQNYALGSQRTALLTAAFPTKIAPYCRPGDVLVMMEITNEARDGLSAQQMYDNYVAYATQARASGLIVVMCTCPAGKLTTDPADTITRQQAANALVLANGNTSWDAVADVGALTNLNSAAGITNSTYYNVDELHLTNVGYDLISPCVFSIIEPFLIAA